MKINKQATELTNLLKENKLLKDQFGTQSKHENKIQNKKREFEDNCRVRNDDLNKAHENIEIKHVKQTAICHKWKNLKEKFQSYLIQFLI